MLSRWAPLIRGGRFTRGGHRGVFREATSTSRGNGRTIALAGLAGLMLGGLLDHQYVYYPGRWQPGDWAGRAKLPLRDVWVTTSDGMKIHGWLVEADGSPGVLLWSHGNAGTIIDRLPVVQALHARGLSVLLFDYRGYGQSQGRPSEPGLYRDAEAMYEELTVRRAVAPERVVLFGSSLGAAVATETATRHPAAGLILETPFPSIPAVAQSLYGSLPLHLLLAARYDVVSRLPNVRMPILVIHGDQDRIIPLALGRRVYDVAPQPKSFYVVPGADHNDIPWVAGPQYVQRLREFVEQVTAGRPKRED